ncbi:hypothetical protein D3C85_743400 [compost metagenome]
MGVDVVHGVFQAAIAEHWQQGTEDILLHELHVVAHVEHQVRSQLAHAACVFRIGQRHHPRPRTVAPVSGTAGSSRVPQYRSRREAVPAARPARAGTRSLAGPGRQPVSGQSRAGRLEHAISACERPPPCGVRARSGTGTADTWSFRTCPRRTRPTRRRVRQS